VFACVCRVHCCPCSYTPPFPGVYPSMALEGRWEARLHLGDDGRYRVRPWHVTYNS
jgi:hypothetical protein